MPKARRFNGPPGTRVLIDSNVGPLFAIAPRDEFQDAVLGVEIVSIDDKGDRWANTDWPLRLSFPVFILNALEYLATADQVAATGSVSPGQPVALPGQPDQERLTLELHDGKTTVLERGKNNRFSFSGTDQLGIYRVEQGGQAVPSFTVNLFDAAETDIGRAVRT